MDENKSFSSVQMKKFHWLHEIESFSLIDENGYFFSLVPTIVDETDLFHLLKTSMDEISLFH